jgi:hypothetical protein
LEKPEKHSKGENMRIREYWEWEREREEGERE